MTAKHTPGPWTANFEHHARANDAQFMVCRDDNHPLAVLSADGWIGISERKANARRIVACVNACDGIETALLEGFSPRFLATLPDRHLEQRNDLLKALRRLSFAAMARDNTMGDQCGLFAAQSELRDANKLAMEAIAKATGEPS